MSKQQQAKRTFVKSMTALVPGREVSVGVCGALLAFLACAAAKGTEPLVRVEEDWKVEVNIPSPDDHAPQIVNSISPTGSLSGLHAVFELNHRSLDEYGPGGMQLQIWSGDSSLDHLTRPNNALLRFESETVTYTIAMSVDNGALTVEVKNGSSQTWGNFGRVGWFKLSSSTSLNDLNSYDPATSINNSRVGFASHRVKRFSRTQVRTYSADGLVSTDSTERVVHVHVPQE